MGKENIVESHEELLSSNWYAPIVHSCVIKKKEKLIAYCSISADLWFLFYLYISNSQEVSFAQLKKEPTS